MTEVKDLSMYTKNIGCWALIEITDNKCIQLIATLNPDAEEPICGETYSSEWSLPIDEAIDKFKNKGFWRAWDEITSRTPGGIDLTDGLTEDELFQFMGHDITENLCGNSTYIADKLDTLDAGEYLIVVSDDNY